MLFKQLLFKYQKMFCFKKGATSEELGATEKGISVFSFITLINLINVILYCFPLYKYVFSKLDVFSWGGALTLLSTVILLYTITSVILYLISLVSLKALKVFCAAMMLTNALAIYFVFTYNIVLDRTMMGNVFNTNVAEATSYYSPKIFAYLFVLGVLPAFLVSKIGVRKTKRLHLAAQPAAILLIASFLMYLNSSTWLWIDKNASSLGALAMPWSYTINAARYQLQEIKKNKKQTLLPDATFSDDRNTLVVLVIGESARSANFSLYGYSRETNPYLRQLDITALKDAKSASTYTTASLNSILSPDGSMSGNTEPLSSYLQRQGVHVIWRSNNWGDPPMKVKTYQKAAELKESCTGDGCQYDEVLLTGLDDVIKASAGSKTLLVLHTAGSHGPLYNKKYPPAFETFTPVCTTVDLQECSEQELINAYDNTILYTDYFLSQVIEQLKKNADIPSVMIYISDHGESLGEYGLYLHGTPYTLAPDFQKDIPFIFWSSPKFAAEKKLAGKQYNGRYGQNNIFPTIMGAFGMTSKIYDPERDLFAQAP